MIANHAFTQALALQKSVFAHVIVGNTASHEINSWDHDIKLAAAAGIDGFALNIAYLDPNTQVQVSYAFAAAESSEFQLYFSFDYLGGSGPWPPAGEDSIISYLKQYKDNKSYYYYAGKPFVSTFEGVENVQDWASEGPIRSAIGDFYFVPNWTSLGPSGIGAYLVMIQGAFSWNMWPEGLRNMTTLSDKQWQQALGERSYMMGISPWFFKSAGGGKHWVWKTGHLWADRWAQIEELQPDHLQIISWNDYGESHYIGPVHSLSEIPMKSVLYVSGMPHESWRDFLPYYIARYKRAPFNITRDQVQYWYHNSGTSGGADCGVVGNNANQGQVETSPHSLIEDMMFISALLRSPADVYVQIGDNPRRKHSGTEGINHWNQPFNGETGEPKLSLVRNGTIVRKGEGVLVSPKTNLPNGCANFNAWVGSF